MKKTYFLIVTILLAVCGCHPQASKDTEYFTQISDSVDYICRIQTPNGPDTIAVSKQYNIQWPTGASKELRLRLMHLAFDDGTGVDDIRMVTEHFLDDMMLWEEDTLIQAMLTETPIPDTMKMNESEVSISCVSDKGIQTFIVNRFKYIFPGAHGMHWTLFVVYDSTQQQIVELNDLLDTNQLGPVIDRAIEELEINQEVSECKYEQDILPLTPLTDNYYIDFSKKTLTLVYQPYTIAPYSCGTMFVTLPIDWLKWQIALTQKCKEMFGL